MDRGKKILANASTLVDLKAELFRKQDEFRKAKNKNEPVGRPTLKLGKKFAPPVDSLGKSNSGVASRQEKDKQFYINEENLEESKALTASRRKLEEKSRLYEKLQAGNHIPDDDNVYMVDFRRKAADIVRPVNKDEESTELSPTIGEDNKAYSSNNENDEWVDYTDSLGRTKRCLRKDLPDMQAMDAELQQRTTQRSPSPDSDGPSSPLEEEWKEVQQTPVGPLHYQNVQFGEIRTHGVGYYAFSQSEEERKQQMEALNDLRNQTKEQRLKREQIKAKRQAALKVRLEKVKQRKRLKTGKVLLDSEPSDSEDDVPSANIEALAEEKPVAEEKKEEKPVPVRPWDRGKIGVSRTIQPFRKASQKDYISERREDRPAEFAPPQFYYQSNRDVEEMHSFFKQQQAAHSSRAEQNPSSWTPPAEPFTPADNINDIPLPDV